MGKTKKAKANSDDELSYETVRELFERASERLEHAELSIAEIKAILDRAGQMVKRAKGERDKELQADAVEVQLRAKRRIGQMVFGSAD
jgi:hypothetical protein